MERDSHHLDYCDFTDADVLDQKPNKYTPLLITVVMANYEVRRNLVDQGSSADILFVDLLATLNISREDLSAYQGTDLSGFNGSKPKPLGYFDLMLTYGADSQKNLAL